MAERAAKGQEGGHAGLMAAEASSGAGGEHAKPHARSWSESGDGQEQCGDGDDGEMTEALEELILEAYNNMQSDGEFIFLPDHVARKLHEAARLLQLEDADETSQAAEPSPEPTAAASSESDSGNSARSPNMAVDVTKMIGKLATFQLGAHAMPEVTAPAGGDSGARGDYPVHHREQQPPPQIASRDLLPRTRSSELLFTDLAPVIETDEEASSGPSSPAGDRGDNQDSHTSSSSSSSQPMPPPPPPPSDPHSASSRSHSTLHHTKVHAASPATTPRTADKKESESAASTYEKRRQAALKLKEDKARRAQEKHDAAKKQREDARRELEEVQRKEMEEKRERVRRMRQQREQRKSTTTAKPVR